MKTSEIEKLVEKEFDPDFPIWERTPEDLGFSEKSYIFYLNSWSNKLIESKDLTNSEILDEKIISKIFYFCEVEQMSRSDSSVVTINPKKLLEIKDVLEEIDFDFALKLYERMGALKDISDENIFITNHMSNAIKKDEYHITKQDQYYNKAGVLFALKPFSAKKLYDGKIIFPMKLKFNRCGRGISAYPINSFGNRFKELIVVREDESIEKYPLIFRINPPEENLCDGNLYINICNAHFLEVYVSNVKECETFDGSTYKELSDDAPGYLCYAFEDKDAFFKPELAGRGFNHSFNYFELEDLFDYFLSEENNEELFGIFAIIERYFNNEKIIPARVYLFNEKILNEHDGKKIELDAESLGVHSLYFIKDVL